MHNFRQLNIWKESMQLAKDVYTITKTFPAEEKFGLVSQLNRCGISVPSNIAEGSARSSYKEFCHFLKVALGSLFEMETQIILANNFNLILTSAYEPLLLKIRTLQKMITNFIRKIEQENKQ